MDKAFDLIGLGPPFLYAIAAYGLFHFLDQRASKEAKHAIAQWLRPASHNKAQLKTAIIELFDRIYGQPLLSLRAFRRSALISIILSLLYVAIYSNIRKRDLDWWLEPTSWRIIRDTILLPLAFNILSDYASLFIVRPVLALKWPSQTAVVTLGAISGASVIAVLFIIRRTAFYMFALHNNSSNIFIVFKRPEIFIESEYITYSEIGIGATLIWPALVAHLWLLLLGLAATFVRLFNYLIWSMKKAQWFIDKGDKHPLEALGYVAALTMFLTTTIFHVLN